MTFSSGDGDRDEKICSRLEVIILPFGNIGVFTYVNPEHPKNEEGSGIAFRTKKSGFFEEVLLSRQELEALRDFLVKSLP